MTLLAALALCCAGIAGLAWRQARRRREHKQKAEALFRSQVADMDALRQELQKDNRAEIDESGPLIEGDSLPSEPAPPLPIPAAPPMPATPPMPAPTPTTGPILVCRSFGAGFGDKVILDDVHFTVPAHGVSVLMGPPGTGKSTLLRSLAGAYARTPMHKSWGEVVYQGQPLGEENRPPLVGQRLNLIQRTVLESLLVHRTDRLETMDEAAQRDWVKGWLVELGQEALSEQLDTTLIDLPVARQRAVSILREAMAGGALLMIDEPTTGMKDEDAAYILALLEGLASRMALLVVLHNQKQARQIGQEIILLAGGYVQAQEPVGTFFSAPPNPVAAQFVQTGSCAVPAPGLPEDQAAENALTAPRALSSGALAAVAPRMPAPPTPEEPPPGDKASGPRGFIWIEKGHLAATPMPGATLDLDYDLDLLKQVGVTCLVTLTERSLPEDALLRHGLKAVHLPIADRHAPTPEEMDALAAHMRSLLVQGEVLAVHCLAGLGRTGTILAGFLVKEAGLSARAALEKLRAINRQFVQTDSQEQFLADYEMSRGAPS
ncbi:ATP-binding cassette domain-containing protein [Acidocella sp.]|uniref:phosphatase domain-containing putative toxin n=1 Tax=Acidocella sp. TaxID=50710 RepID=UPI003D07716E